MGSLLFENPLLLGFAGTVLTLIAGFAWLKIGQRILLHACIGLLALTIVLVFVNVNVVSDRERIEETLYRVAEALGKNDHATVVSAIHPNASETVMQAKGELAKYSFNEARVTGIKEIQVNHSTKPPTAIAQFNVYVAVKPDGGRNDFGEFIDVRRFVRVYFMLRDGQWLVRDYEHFEPTAGFRNQSPGSNNPQSPMDVWQQNR